MDEVIVWLVRHGETVWNAEHKISGWIDVELSDRGKQMARDLRPGLEPEQFASVWSSDLQRAIHTAELAYGSPEKQDQRLRELDFGPLEGQNWLTIPKDHQKDVIDFCEHCTRGGEKISAFEERVVSFLDHLPPGRHLLFVHAGVIRVALRRVQADHFLPPTSVAIVNWSREELVELRLPPEIGV